MLGSRALRIVIALFAVFTVASLLLPRMTGFVSSAAMINAPVQTLRAPFDGRVVRAAVVRATPVSPGDLLLEMSAVRETGEEVVRLEAEESVVSGRLHTIETQILAYHRMADRLRNRMVRETDVAALLLDARAAEARGLRDAAGARLRRAREEYERALALADKGTVAVGAVDDLRYAVDEAEAEVQRWDAAISALVLERRAAAEGQNAGAASGATLETRRRLDEIELRVLDLNARYQEVEAELAALRTWLVRARDDDLRVRTFRPRASTGGVIWTAPQIGVADVAEGDPLLEVLDCQRRFVEVTLSERHFERIPAGSRAEVRLVGSNERFTAPVVSLRGVARDGLAATRSAIQRSGTAGGVTLFLALPPADVEDARVAAAFCDVGRSAEVRIVRPFEDRIGSWSDSITSLFARLGWLRPDGIAAAGPS